jgi:hypothetical protein
MWVREIRQQTTAKKEILWQLWADVANWKKWDSTVVSSELYGDFSVGTKGTVKLVAGPKGKFVITVCKPFETFTNRSFIPLCKVDFTLRLVEMENGVLVTYRQEMTGFLTFFFSRVLGKKIEKGLRKGIGDLINNAEKTL